MHHVYTPHFLFLHLVTPVVVFSPNGEKPSIFKRIFGLSLVFNFCCAKYFLDCVIDFRFFEIFKIISVNSSGSFLL